MSNKERLIKMPSTIYTNESDLIRSEDYLTHPVKKELALIIKKSETMSITSLLYKLEEMYLKTTDVLKIYQRVSSKNNQDVKISELDEFGDDKESIPNLIVTNLSDYITEQNIHVINKYFNDIEKKEDRFNIYKKIIKDNKMSFFLETIKDWEKGLFLLKDLEVEKITIDYHDHIMIYKDGFFQKDSEEYRRILNEMNNFKSFYKETNNTLKSEAFILLLQELLYNDESLNIEISLKTLVRLLHMKHNFPDIKESDILSNPDLFKINQASSFLKILSHEGFSESDGFYGGLILGDINIKTEEDFFNKENTMLLNLKNLKDFLIDYIKMKFNNEKETKLINIVNVNYEKNILKHDINLESPKTTIKNRL